MNQALRDTYTKWANSALEYCRWTFVIGASNKQDDIFRTGGWASESVSRLREEGTASKQTTREGFLNTVASEAAAARCGNCGEQAAVAFQYLRDKFGARPLDYMILNPSNATRKLRGEQGGGIHSLESGVCDGDHVFVVIGRTGGNDANMSTWDVEAVACDPWAGVVCPAYEYSGKGPCGAGWHPTKSYFRVA